MTTSSTNDFYALARANALDRFSGLIQGSDSGLFLVVHTHSLDGSVRDALAATASALGYPTTPTYVRAESENDEVPFPDRATDVAGGASGEHSDDVRRVMEALDPLVVVMADSCAKLRCESVYRCSIPSMKAARLAGRSCCAFDDIGTLIASPEGKQKAWAVLKTLPRFPF